MKKIGIITVLILLIGCSSSSNLKSVIEQPVVVELQENAVPGTVNDVWEEPMHDTVRVPAQLDPTGTYFRPNHQTVVEIYPGRVQPVQYPNKR